MTSLTDQLSAVRQSQWEAQLDIFRTLTSRALDSTEQLINLNLRASRTSVEQVTGTFKQLLDAASPQDLLAVTSRAQGQWHYLFSYGRELLGIAGGAQGNWSGQPAVQALAAPFQLMTAPSANIPTSFAQVLEQASIATAESTTVTTEIAAAAVDTGAALAQATLHAGSEAAAAVSEAAAPAAEAAPAPAPAPEPADEVVQRFEAAVDTAIADDVPPAKPTPLAAALNEAAPKPAAAEHPVASTLPLETPDQIALPSVAPVDAVPPVRVAVPPAPPQHSSKAPRASRSRK